MEGCATPPDAASDTRGFRKSLREHQPPPATLTFKTYETTAGICLKYRTTKSAEVGRLMTGLGKLARGENVEHSNALALGTETKEPKAEEMTNIGAQSPKVERVADAAGANAKAKKRRGKK